MTHVIRLRIIITQKCLLKDFSRQYIILENFTAMLIQWNATVPLLPDDLWMPSG